MGSDRRNWPADMTGHEVDVERAVAEIERLREVLTHAAQALSGCVCSMADADLMQEITDALDEDD